MGHTAAIVLRTVGTVAAVPPLRAARARKATRELKEAAAAALAAIHSRLGPVDAGGLSLAAGEDGALSLIEDKAPPR